MLALTGSVWAQTYETVRIATYNVLNYPGSDSATRNPEFRKILQTINPDILIVEEMNSAAGLSGFLTNVLNYGQPGTYASAPFNDGPDTDNGMYYKTAKFSFIGPQTVLSTALRDINGYRLRRTTLTVDSLDIQIYAAHLKASSGSSNEALRAAEAQILRDHLNSLTPGYFIAGGDFNLYTSSEQAYQNLIGSQTDNSGRLYDPINTPGAWHTSTSFLNIFTQATQAANGGLDDRFDFLLTSAAFQNATGWQYVSGTYTEYGNDGTDRRSASINSPTNTAVPDSIANALFAVSDHLPVYFEARRPLSNLTTITLMVPNGGENWYIGNPYNITWTSQNLTGNVTLKLNRSYPAGAWETLFSGIANDGSESWTATVPVSSTARILVISDSQTSVRDSSDANFTIALPTITLTTPNGGENWYVGNPYTITWTSQNLTGNVTLKLNRSYPTGAWETLFSGIANDGSEGWTATAPATSAARLLVISDSQTSVRDSSDADFSIIPATITLTAPNGGENWMVGISQIIQWTSSAVQGNVRIELDRAYPSGTWETINSNTLNDGAESWTVTGPTGNHVRIRVMSINTASAGDTSNTDFAVVHSALPVLVHEYHGDAAPGPVTFTAEISDDFPGVFARLFYRLTSASVFDSLNMTATGNPLEVSAVPTLGFGNWTYFIRATDSEGQTSSTDINTLSVSAPCGTAITYDDGTAEVFNWAPADSFSWAVRFTPPQTPFAICEASVLVATFHPDSTHSPIIVGVWAADGPGGLPGTLLREVVRGSIGNVIGGFTAPGGRTAAFNLHDDLFNPIEVNGDFYISVQNAGTRNDAFGMDTSSTPANRSVLYDGCTHQWLAENGVNPNTRNGNRIIRVKGWVERPAELVIWTSGNDVHLNWSTTGAAYYKVFRAYTPDFNGAELITTTTDTTTVITGQISSQSKVFYRIESSSTP